MCNQIIILSNEYFFKSLYSSFTQAKYNTLVCRSTRTTDQKDVVTLMFTSNTVLGKDNLKQTLKPFSHFSLDQCLIFFGPTLGPTCHHRGQPHPTGKDATAWSVSAGFRHTLTSQRPAGRRKVIHEKTEPGVASVATLVWVAVVVW